MAPVQVAFGVGTFNIQNLTDLSREDTRACAHLLGLHAGIVGCQETIEAEDDTDLDTELPPKDWYHEGRTTENDVMVRRSRFVASNTKVIPLHGGLARVSPARTAVETLIGFRENTGFTRMAFVNTHLVSGVEAKKERLPWRVAARATAFAKLQARVAELVTAGYNVVFVGDTNWKAMPKLHPDMVWFSADGIDKIGYVPAPKANWTLKCLSIEKHPNPSDHDYLVANVVAVAKPVPPAPPVSPVDTWLTKYGKALTPDAVAALRKIVR